MKVSRALWPLVAIVAAWGVIAACGGDDDASPTPPRTGDIAGQATTQIQIGSATPAPTTAGDRQLEILDSGYTALRGGLQGGMIVHSKNQTEAGEISYSVELVLSDGTTSPGPYGTIVIFPDQTIGEALESSYAPADATVQSLNITINPASGRWYPYSTKTQLTAAVTQTDASGTLNGTVTNPLDHDTGNIWLQVIGYNAAGKIVGGGTQGVDSVAANSTGPFTSRVPFVENDPVATTKVWAEYQNQLPIWITNP